MDYFLVYLILRLDTLSCIVGISTVIAGIFFIVTILIYVLNDDEDICDRVKPWSKPFFIVFCVFLFSNVLVPDTKQAAVVYCLPKVVNNEQVQKIPDNLLRLANTWIDEAISKAEEAVPKKPHSDTNSTSEN